MSSSSLSVMVHGGAGRLPHERAIKKIPFMKEATDAAWRLLCSGKPAEYAVAEALQVMERAECFNAGFGGYPNVHGIVLLDVGMMKGDRSFISLLNVRRIKFPSSVALDMLKDHSALMTVWTHEMMQQVENAPEFIRERYGLVGSHAELIAPSVRQLIAEKAELELTANSSDNDPAGGTVGCIVRDVNGRLAAGTSTGGVHLKHNGRIGDSPIIGSGVYADDEIGCLSTSGHGETLLLSLISGFVLGLMRERLRNNPNFFAEQPEELQSLLHAEFKELSQKIVGRGGAMIVLPPRGNPTYSFNTEMFSVGYRYGDAKSIVDEGVFIEYEDGTRLT